MSCAVCVSGTTNGRYVLFHTILTTTREHLLLLPIFGEETGFSEVYMTYPISVNYEVAPTDSEAPTLPSLCWGLTIVGEKC